MVEAQALSGISDIRHGFFDRQGGASKGLFASLNCGLGSGDNRETVLENRAEVASRLNLAQDQLLMVHQHHSPEIITVTDPWDMAEAPKADGMVTNQANIGLGILTADCAPVLFADPSANIIGAAHAGWRGALSGVTDNIIAAMEKLGAKRSAIIAVIGPTISRTAYEVGPEFIQTFLSQDKGHQQFFTPSTRDQHFMFDLPEYLLQRLQRAHIAAASWVDICTYKQENRFFSYRRCTHNQETDYGRQISVITMN